VLLEKTSDALEQLPVDHRVKPAAVRGGQSCARQRLKQFLEKNLRSYGELTDEPEADVASGPSPYLHFGNISVHEVFDSLARREKWKPGRLALRTNGSLEGWWNMSSAAESFLDELINWREVGYNFSAHRDDCGCFDSLPR
jgi:deoxyribodipyrimidine photo-lyase